MFSVFKVLEATHKILSPQLAKENIKLTLSVDESAAIKALTSSVNFPTASLWFGGDAPLGDNAGSMIKARFNVDILLPHTIGIMGSEAGVSSPKMLEAAEKVRAHFLSLKFRSPNDCGHVDPRGYGVPTSLWIADENACLLGYRLIFPLNISPTIAPMTEAILSE